MAINGHLKRIIHTLARAMKMIKELKRYMAQHNAETVGSASLDVKLSLLYSLPIMICGIIGEPTLSPGRLVIIACGLAVLVASISVAHRVRRRWSWPGIQAKHILYAILNIIVSVAFFLYISRTIDHEATLTFCFLFWGFIAFLNTLRALRIVTVEQNVFLMNCKDGQQSNGGW